MVIKAKTFEKLGQVVIVNDDPNDILKYGLSMVVIGAGHIGSKSALVFADKHCNAEVEDVMTWIKKDMGAGSKKYKNSGFILE